MLETDRNRLAVLVSHFTGRWHPRSMMAFLTSLDRRSLMAYVHRCTTSLESTACWHWPLCHIFKF